MNGLRQRLLFLILLLAAVSYACAEPVAETVPAMQPEVKAEPGGGPLAGEAGTIKVSRLEPDVSVSAVMTAEERQLEQRKTDFLKFAAKKLKDMNRNHILSRERMRIEKRPDGSYKASFHHLDDSSMSCQVSRSPTRGAQYVAVLSYTERVYTTSCRTPAECRQGEFSPAEVIPNRHIFVYNNGVWQ